MICATCGHEQDRGRFCGRCGARVAAATGSGSGPEVPATPARGPSPRSLAVVAIGLLVLGVAVAVLAGDRAGDAVVASPQGPADRGAVRVPLPSPVPSPTGTAPHHGEAVFTDQTGLVALFDDGQEGALALDLDTGHTERVDLPGQRAGDQPFRLLRLGGWLVVGWGEIVAVAPGTDLPPRSLGTATVALPAAEPDQLWLVDATGDGAGTWRLVDAAGETLHERPAIIGFEALRGVPGGLGLRNDEGTLWRYDVATGRLHVVAGGTGRIADATRDRVAWCETDQCDRVVVSATGGEDVTVALDGFSDPHDIWLSPEGDRLATVTIHRVGAAVDRRLQIRSVADGALLASAQLPLGSAYGAWSDDGHQFLSWVHAPGSGGAPALLSRWNADAIEQVDVGALGVRDVYSFVLLPRAAVPGLRGCDVSPASDEMGSLPARRGEHVHVALPREAPADEVTQLWIGIPGAGQETTVTVSAARTDGVAQAEFRLGSQAAWRAELTTSSGMRTAGGFPPHWAFESRFPSGGCWSVTVTTPEVTDTVTIDLG